MSTQGWEDLITLFERLKNKAIGGPTKENYTVVDCCLKSVALTF